MGFIKNLIPSLALAGKVLVVIVVDKKLRISDRVAAMIPFGL